MKLAFQQSQKAKLSSALLGMTSWRSKTAMEVYLQAYLTSAPDGDNWSISRPGRLASAERAPCTHWTGGSVGSRASNETGGNKHLLLRQESNVDFSVAYPLAESLYRLSYHCTISTVSKSKSKITSSKEKKYFGALPWAEQGATTTVRICH
jgi:hypothetical protein